MQGSATALVVMPGAPATVVLNAAAIYGGLLVPYPGSVDMTTADTLVMSVLVLDDAGDEVPLSRVLAASMSIAVTLGPTPCILSSPRGNLQFPRSSTPDVNFAWTSRTDMANFTALAVCLAPTPGSWGLNATLHLRNGTVKASASVEVVVTSQPPAALVPAVVFDPGLSTPLSLAASPAFGPLPVTSIVALTSTPVVTRFVSAGSVALLTFQALGPRYEPLLVGQLGNAVTFNMSASGRQIQCVFMGLEHSPTGEQSYTIAAACCFPSAGLYTAALTLSDGGTVHRATYPGLTVHSGVPTLNASRVNVSSVDEFVLLVETSMYDGDNFAVDSDAAVNVLACLLPLYSAASITCTQMGRMNVSGSLVLSAYISSAPLVSGEYSVVLLQTAPCPSTAIIGGFIASAGAQPSRPTVTSAAIQPAACECQCLLAALVNKPVTVWMPVGIAVTLVVTDEARSVTLASITPVCGDIWCEFVIFVQTLEAPYFRLSFFDASVVPVSTSLSCLTCVFKTPTLSALNTGSSGVNASSMPTSAALTSSQTPFSILTLPTFAISPLLVDDNGSAICSDSIAFDGDHLAVSNGGVLGLVLTFNSWDGLRPSSCDVWWSVYVPGQCKF